MLPLISIFHFSPPNLSLASIVCCKTDSRWPCISPSPKGNLALSSGDRQSSASSHNERFVFRAETTTGIPEGWLSCYPVISPVSRVVSPSSIILGQIPEPEVEIQFQQQVAALQELGLFLALQLPLPGKRWALSCGQGETRVSKHG